MERDQKKLELKDVLLPTHVKPSKYFVEITPHFESFSFNGFETIEIEGTQCSSCCASSASSTYLCCDMLPTRRSLLASVD
jgi:hypothetical protein